MKVSTFLGEGVVIKTLKPVVWLGIGLLAGLLSSRRQPPWGQTGRGGSPARRGLQDSTPYVMLVESDVKQGVRGVLP